MPAFQQGCSRSARIVAVEGVKDRAVARAAGLVPGGLAVLAHSGSRALGKALAAAWPEGPLGADALDRWRAELAGAVRYARTNRLLLAWRLLRALGAARPAKIGGALDVVHNTVAPARVGDEAALCSVAHGAGRRMTRGEAFEKVRARHSRASLVRTPLGGRVNRDDPALLYEEHPDAYKPIEPVVDALEVHGAARRLAALRPMITVKR